MTERAAHLVDHVIPDVPVRQSGVPDARTGRVGVEWVLTLPHRIRYLLAWRHDLCKAVVRVLLREVHRHLRTRARERGLSEVRGGAVAILQRFGRWVYYSTRASQTVTDPVLKKVPVDGGPAITVTTERLRNVIGLDSATLYYLFERLLVDGTPDFEIRAATPEDAPFRVLAHISASRVPIWQTVNPALSPDGKWLAQALTDGVTTNVWALSTTRGEWRQTTDFGERATFIARRVSWSSDGRSILAAVAEGDSDIVLLEGLTNVGRQ